MIVDLPNHCYERPSFLVPDLKPDLVVWNEVDLICYIIELTICFDTITEKAAERKSLKYFDLAEYITLPGFSYHVITLQVGSRGFVDLCSFSPLKSLMSVSGNIFNSFLVQVAADVIIGSFYIWSRRNCNS